MQAVQSLASDHFRLLDVRGASDPPLLSPSKITNWNTRFEVLGWLVDTAQGLTVTSPPHKRLKLRLLLAEWPPTRIYASAKQVSHLAGFLTHISFAVPRGSFFVHRLLASVGMPRIAAGDHFAGRMANPGRRVALGPEFHADLEFWRWFVFSRVRRDVVGADVSFAGAPGTTYVVLGRVKKRRPGILSRNRCLPGRYDLTAQEQPRCCGSCKSVRGVDDLSINVLELLGMVVSAFVLVSSCADRPSATGEIVLCCGETTRPRCIGCGGVEGGGWNRVSVPSCVSSALSKCHLDGISRRRMFVVSTTLPPTVSLAGITAPFLIFLRAVRPNVPWQVQELGTIGISLCTSVLASDSCDTPLRPRLNELIWGIDILAHG